MATSGAIVLITENPFYGILSLAIGLPAIIMVSAFSFYRQYIRKKSSPVHPERHRGSLDHTEQLERLILDPQSPLSPNSDDPLSPFTPFTPQTQGRVPALSGSITLIAIPRENEAEREHLKTQSEHSEILSKRDSDKAFDEMSKQTSPKNICRGRKVLSRTRFYALTSYTFT